MLLLWDSTTCFLNSVLWTTKKWSLGETSKSLTKSTILPLRPIVRSQNCENLITHVVLGLAEKAAWNKQMLDINETINFVPFLSVGMSWVVRYFRGARTILSDPLLDSSACSSWLTDLTTDEALYKLRETFALNLGAGVDAKNGALREENW